MPIEKKTERRIRAWFNKQDQKPSLVLRSFYASMALANVIATVGAGPILLSLEAADAYRRWRARRRRAS